ncbi:MAG: TetR family transcriptional regulator [Sphingobium sp.]
MAERKKTGKIAILDAAETLFARLGYYGVSLRDITSEAKVELGLSSYHFGKKEELFRQVVERRADEMCQIELAALDAVVAAAGDLVPTVEQILRAYVMTRFDLSYARGAEWADYTRLSHHFLALDDRGRFIGHYRDVARTIGAAYVDALARTLPSTPRDKIAILFDMMRLTLTSITADTTSTVIEADTPEGREVAARKLIHVFAAGLKTLDPAD